MRNAIGTALLALSAAILTQACTDSIQPDSTTPPGVEDHEFDTGSRIAAQDLTTNQIENLALLAKVWGFAKYHHPGVVDGSRNWDYDLLRAIPPVLAAPDRATATAAMMTWLDELGPVPTCSPCAQPPSGAYLQPDNGWIEDAAVLGTALSERLAEIYQNRPASNEQRYISFYVAGNPNFSWETLYQNLPDPDAGYRLLALFRFWNIIHYWFPYRDVMDEDWDGVLREFIPDMMEAMTGETYRRTLIRLIGRVHDTHANIWSDLHVQPPTGEEVAPLALRFIEGKLVLTRMAHVDGLATGLEHGDVIHSIDGRSVESLVDSLRPYYPASNEAVLLRDIARNVTRGTGPVLVEGVGTDGVFSKVVSRVPVDATWRFAYDHDLQSLSVFGMLSDSVAYLKISTAMAQDATEYITEARDAAVLVIDCRGYPSDYLVLALGGHLVAGPVPFARFTRADPTNPGAFLWTEPELLMPLEPRFTGKVVILVDETTQSAAEYLAMAFRAAPNAIVVGSTTAGADGNVSGIPLPGGVMGMISGIGVFYPDGTPTQRVGIVPDLEVRPTIDGIRVGGDEVLEEGISHVLGRDFRLSGGPGRPIPPWPRPGPAAAGIGDD